MFGIVRGVKKFLSGGEELSEEEQQMWKDKEEAVWAKYEADMKLFKETKEFKEHEKREEARRAALKAPREYAKAAKPKPAPKKPKKAAAVKKALNLKRKEV